MDNYHGDEHLSFDDDYVEHDYDYYEEEWWPRLNERMN